MQSSHCHFVRKDTNFTHIKTLRTRIDNDFYYFCSELIYNAMRKAFFVSLLTLWCAFVYAQPTITDLSFQKSVNVFGLFEMSFQLGKYNNPYDPEVIDVYAEFTAPNGKTFKVNGFYYEGYTFQQKNDYEVASASQDKGWRVRFTPNQAGKWTFSLHAIDRKGTTTLSTSNNYPTAFECRSIDTALGFIRKANTRYLKREVVQNGESKYQAFFPIGPNIAWYNYKGSSAYPKGIYDYNYYIDELSGSANFMRIWLSRYQYLSLYGPEFTQMNGKKATVYFDSTLNQKDAAELDYIIAYAAKNGITVTPCFFTFGDFGSMHNSSSRWANNPYNTILGLKSPTQFFTDKEAKRITRNLIRYIIARWGYATNIVYWELWNEVDNIPNENLAKEQFNKYIVDWHNEMTSYIRSIDPFKHPISTSNVSSKPTDDLFPKLYASMDLVQVHTYNNIQKAKSKEEQCYNLYQKSINAHNIYPDKPCFVEEFGFGQSSSDVKYKDKDPKGIDTHNSLWSSLFTNAIGPASFWYWDYLDAQKLLRIYEPIMTFSKNLPLLSDDFKAYCTAKTTKSSTIFPNGIQTYYLSNTAEDSIYGWCQDTAFSYQSLRRLADKKITNGHFDTLGISDANGYVYTLDTEKKPRPSSKSNTIILPITNQPIGAAYDIRWFDAETGAEIIQERTTAYVKCSEKHGTHLAFDFPSSIRGVKKKTINSTLCDAAFILYLQQDDKNNGDTQSKNVANDKKRRIKFTY